MIYEDKRILEFITYFAVGIATTIVNFIVYFMCTYFNFHYLLANTIAWIFAVLFAYGMNRKYVFKSQTHEKKEFIQFLSLRFITLFIENFLLFLCIKVVMKNENLAKILVSFITVIGNYVFCKFIIFK